MRALIALLMFVVVGPVAASAQQINLSVSGLPLTFATPTGADFAAGFIESAAQTTFTVNAASGPANALRTTTVSVRCRTPCPSNGSKPLATLQWRRIDQAGWNTLSTTNMVVESRPQRRNDTNDPWTNAIVWRFLLDWNTDVPGPATRFDIVFTLTVTTP